jgi:hypothetical protein
LPGSCLSGLTANITRRTVKADNSSDERAGPPTATVLAFLLPAGARTIALLGVDPALPVRTKTGAGAGVDDSL